MSGIRVLLLDDDDDLRDDVAAALRRHGHAVDEVRLIAQADEHWAVNDYDVVVLDRALPDGDAAGLVRRARETGRTTPVLFLSARSQVDDRVAGLDAGGDDYLVKPFALDELLARLRSLGRRGNRVDQPVLVLADLTVDLGRMRAERGLRELLLTPKEFALLAYLVRHAGRAVSRTELIEHCWDEFADPGSNVVDVRVRLLRRKIGEPALVHTVRGSGYVAELRP